MYVKWKGYDNSFNSWIVKKSLYKMSQYFFESYTYSGKNINVKVDLSNYATKLHLKNATGDNTSNLVAKSDLASLKAGTDKIDVGKLKTVCFDWSKFRNVVNNEIVKKAVYEKLVKKENKIDASGFVLKTK